MTSHNSSPPAAISPNFTQPYRSENVLEPPNSWLACVTTMNILTFCVMLTECICVLYGSQKKQRLLPYTAVTGSPYVDSVRLLNWIKPVLLPYSRKEAPNLVDTLDRAILSHWAPRKHSTCSDMRRLSRRRDCCNSGYEVPSKEIVSVSNTPSPVPYSVELTTLMSRMYCR
jgi:hypothetical protein